MKKNEDFSGDGRGSITLPFGYFPQHLGFALFPYL
jgi:hypothetical protein